MMLTPVPITHSIVISHSTPFIPGTYKVANSGEFLLKVTGSNYTLDMKGVNLNGYGTGTGILISNANYVTLENCNVKGFTWGIILKNCSHVTLRNCNASDNKNLKPGTVIDESGENPQDTHGGGLLVIRSTKCAFQQCIAKYEWDGIDLINSNSCIIQNSVFSRNSNWGLHLWNASNNQFKNNIARWCTTLAGAQTQGESGYQTLDSAGLCIEHGSMNNLIQNNDLSYGGDGIFIRDNLGGVSALSPIPPKYSSDSNRLIGNNCSFSPNNAIEADFVSHTLIKGNNCSNSNFGMWLGYSRYSTVENNSCLNDTSHAVQIENGQNGTFISNIFGRMGTVNTSSLVMLDQNGRDAVQSGPYLFKKNEFFCNGTAIELIDTHLVILDHNSFSPLPGQHLTQVQSDDKSKVVYISQVHNSKE